MTTSLQTQTSFRIRCKKDQIDKIPELRDLNWQPAYPLSLDADPALLANRIQQNQTTLLLNDRAEAKALYNKLQLEYKVVVFRNWLD